MFINLKGVVMEKIRLDCGACKNEKSMEATKIPKFSGFIRFIGFIIVMPSIIGILIALIMFFAIGSATNEVMTSSNGGAEVAGAAIGTTIGFGLSLLIGFGSLVGGLIGWLLLMKKKLFKCINSGYIMDRG